MTYHSTDRRKMGLPSWEMPSEVTDVDPVDPVEHLDIILSRIAMHLGLMDFGYEENLETNKQHILESFEQLHQWRDRRLKAARVPKGDAHPHSYRIHDLRERSEKHRMLLGNARYEQEVRNALLEEVRNLVFRLPTSKLERVCNVLQQEAEARYEDEGEKFFSDEP